MVSTRRTTKAPSSSSRPSSPSPPPASPRGRKRTPSASTILRSRTKKNGEEEDIPISTKETKNHQKHGYEFGGPIGAICITILLPLTCYFLVFACNETTGCDLIESIIGLAKEKKKNSFSLLMIPEKMTPVFSLESCVLFLGWIGWCVMLHALLPASIVKEGVDITSGESGGEKARFRLRYKLNGFRVFMTTAVACAVGTYFGQIQLRSLHAKFLSLLTAGCAFAFALTTFLYVASFRVNKNDKSKKKKKKRKNNNSKKKTKKNIKQRRKMFFHEGLQYHLGGT